MTVVYTFFEKQREKRWNFERKVLGELSLRKLKKDVKEHFHPLFSFQFFHCPFLFDPCMDTAIDAYLLGAEYSRFGFFGESAQQAKMRCEEQLKDIIFQLYDFLEPWYQYCFPSMESLVIAVDHFVDKWWEKGFHEGKKRYKLRLN